jgi:hypothetical protein
MTGVYMRSRCAVFHPTRYHNIIIVAGAALVFVTFTTGFRRLGFDADIFLPIL